VMVLTGVLNPPRLESRSFKFSILAFTLSMVLENPVSWEIISSSNRALIRALVSSPRI
jgi:hypothetical protein